MVFSKQMNFPNSYALHNTLTTFITNPQINFRSFAKSFNFYHNMSKFDEIRYFHDHEVNERLQSIARDPMMKALMNFTFPGVDEQVWLEQFKNVHSISDFQHQFVAYAVRQILAKSSEGLTTSGFEKLDKKPLIFSSQTTGILFWILHCLILYCWKAGIL
jgi:hypothetical protein